MEANCWNYLCSQLLSAFGSYTAVPIEPGVRDLNFATGLRPAFITLFTQWVHCFSGLTPEPAWHLGKVTNKLPVDFLESCVQTVHTAERGAFASALVPPLFLPRPPPSWHRRWAVSWSQRAGSSENT